MSRLDGRKGGGRFRAGTTAEPAILLECGTAVCCRGLDKGLMSPYLDEKVMPRGLNSIRCISLNINKREFRAFYVLISTSAPFLATINISKPRARKPLDNKCIPCSLHKHRPRKSIQKIKLKINQYRMVYRK